MSEYPRVVWECDDKRIVAKHPVGLSGLPDVVLETRIAEKTDAMGETVQYWATSDWSLPFGRTMVQKALLQMREQIDALTHEAQP